MAAPPSEPPALVPQQSVRALDESDKALKIPIEVLFDSFVCPICINVFRDAHMTPCGHNFCQACILECLNLKHVCPLCNADTLQAQLIRNHALDALLQRVSDARAPAQAEYMAGLLSGGGGSGTAGLSAVEEAFRRRSRDALLGFQAYLGELERETAAAVAREPAREAALRARLERSAAALVGDLEAHMEAVAPPVALLPASVALSVPARQTAFNVQLRPHTTPGDVVQLLAERLGAVRVEPGWALSLAADGEPAVPLPAADAPVFEQNGGRRVDGGAWRLVFEGDVVLKSEVDACFALEYEEGAGQTHDYQRCNSCGLNWICAGCARRCHAGHELVPFVQNHVATYACCYCKRGRACVLR